MSVYGMKRADGRVVEIVASNDREAVSAAVARVGDNAVVAEQWDADGMGDDGEEMERLLIWDNEEEAENDPGAKAVAELFAPADRPGDRYPW